MTAPGMDVRIMDAAAQWVQRLRGDSVTEQDIAAWLHWCESDDRHRRAFDEAHRFWQGVGELASGPDAADRIRQLRGPDTVAPVRDRRRWAEFSAAASVALAIIGLLAWRYFAPTQETIASDGATSIVRRTTLPDGSTVELAAKSSVVVEYTEQRRLLALQQGGEAYFSVRPNPSRPFIVSVGNHHVRAVGTAFNVRSAGDRVIVTVDEGTVDVYRADDPQQPMVADSVRVSAGKEAKWIDDIATAAVRQVDPARALAWREGRLEYIDEPLAAVIADVNRYSKRRLIVQEGVATELAFTGTVFANSVEEWLQALPGEFPIELVPRGESELLVVARRSPARPSQETVPPR